MSTEAEVRHKRSRRQAVITRRFVPLSGQEPGPVGFGSRERSRELLEQAFSDGTVEFKIRIPLGFVPCGFLFSLNCLDHFPVDPAIAPINATGHQLVTMCRSICAEERAQILDPLMGSKCLTTYFMAFVVFLFSLYLLFAELDAVLQRLGHGSAPLSPHVADTSDTSADESEASHTRRRVRSKRTFKMKKLWGQMKSVYFSSLGLQVQLANLATSTVASAARMFQV